VKRAKIQFPNGASREVTTTFDERLKMAWDHIKWIAERQSHGYIVLRTFTQDHDRLKLASTQYLDNRDPKFALKVSRFLRLALRKHLHAFYSINSFAVEDAKAKHVSSSRLAQVDADSVKLPASGPKPTRIIKTSAGNHQFLYELNSALGREEIEAVSAHLTNLVGGDRGGHSSAKLFRVPGSFNIKPAYNPLPLVSMINSAGPVHSAVEMLERARAAGLSANPPSLMKRQGSGGPVQSSAAVRRKYFPRLSQDVRLRLRQPHPYKSFTLRFGGKEYVVPKDDRSAIVFQIGAALRDVGATRGEALSIIKSSAFWREREADGKHEKPNRLIEKIFAETAVVETGDDNPIITFDPADWAGKPIPERDWLIDGVIQMRKVTGLYGDGGTGKTTLALQLAISVALGITAVHPVSKNGHRLAGRRSLYSAFAETFRAFRRIGFTTRLRSLFDLLKPRAIAGGANYLSQRLTRSLHRYRSLKQKLKSFGRT